MNNELLLVLDYIEREKGVDKTVVITAIKTALLSAARKRFGEDADDLKVIIDSVTGSIQVFKGDEEVKSRDFGRIAAQMAKQMITQKIREAEREVIHNDFHDKVGDITNGTVHRF